MNTLSGLINKAVLNGYKDSFMITKRGLNTPKDEEKYYTPEDMKINDFYRFEGESDPGDESILYLMETNDGQKGLIIDAYGPYADAVVDKFIQDVQEISKKGSKGNKEAA
jgi:hypothetical protein